MSDRISKILACGILLLAAAGVFAGFDQTLSIDQDIVNVDHSRTSYEDWTVLIRPETMFVPVDPDLPEPFFFEDLAVEHVVLVQGHAEHNEFTFTADIVFVFSDISQYPPFVGGPPPPPDHDRILGSVCTIDIQHHVFHIWVNQYQGEEIDVMILPDAEFWDAPVGSPRTPINLWDFHPGDPVMVHGYMLYDKFRGDAFVRSLDWCPERSDGDSGTVMEIYGWVIHIHHREHGGPVMTIDVDSMTGDPNHQSFSTVIGPSGGYAYFPWGYLFFPVGAIDELVNIQITGDFMFWWTLENIYQFYPSMSFNLPVEIEIRYFNLAGINPELVRLTWFDETSGTWRLASHMTHFVDEHCFRGQINHFSRYSLSTNSRPLQGMPLQSGLR